MRTKPPRSNRSPEVPEQLRNSSPSLLSDPRGAKHISGNGVYQDLATPH
jgi:hypothetical protein